MIYSLLLVPTIMKAQLGYPSSDDFDYNSKVDIVLENDINNTLDTTFSLEDVVLHLSGKEELSLLDKIPEYTSILINRIVCSDNISDEIKTNFLNDYLEKNDSLFYTDVLIKPCETTASSVIIFRLLEEYYRNKEHQIASGLYTIDKYLDFHMYNESSSSYDVLVDYMKDNDIFSYENYFQIPLSLIEHGKETEGVNLFIKWLDKYPILESPIILLKKNNKIGEILPRIYFQVEDLTLRAAILNKVFEILDEHAAKLDQLDDDFLFFFRVCGRRKTT